MLGGWEWVILLVVVVLLFGAKRLPEMARSVGQSARVFKGEMKGMKSDDESTAAAAPAAPPSDSAPGSRPSTPSALPPGGSAAGSRPAPAEADEQPQPRPDDAR